MASDPDSQRKVIKSAARVIQVLEFFDEKKRALSVAEIAAEHDWPHSSTSALMASLVTLGYLHYDASRRTYLPTMRVALLGDWVQDDSFKDGQLMRLMQHLSEVTGEVIVLAAQNGLHSQYLRVVEGTHPLRLHLYIGMLRPLFGSGSGTMLLAQMDDAGITKLARKFNATAVGDARIDVAAVLAQIARDRAQGYALSINQVTPGGALMAMPVPMVAGVKPLVLCISGFTERLVEKEADYAKAMREGMKRFLVE
ncbi:MAG: transcriptional regulator kdgR [Comamonadaceae bacterium]|nr:MAG: transcriptional regulator kdgR [Comamonadaceae bacterium]